ncbi:MAG: FtsQ-type POTRA domain-containing protein [Oscillospiraceae bacterium]|nr:FtsQ-type POTRA domain-containing protein [Oscillospiraceae bacterium]
MAKRKKKMRRKPAISFYAVFAAVLILVIAVLGVSVFFRVNSVEVKGSSFYTQEEVLEVADISTGNIIFFTPTDEAKQRLYDQLPYIYSVDITKTLPDEVTIYINESEAVGYITFSGTDWLIDEHGKVLGKLEGNKDGYIRVTGITPTDANTGKMLRVEEDQQTTLDALVNILTAIEKAGVTEKVKDLDVSNISNATFTYDSIYSIDFGSGVNAEYKIKTLVDVVSKLEAGKKGKIDLSREGETHFIPA